ncbi:MAG: hypothetical protein M3460_06820 [Actinomycetota bacterium]|nr:hypothetical protein [Actinomycetota bacterium]
MAVQVYAATTSVAQGGSLDLHLNDDSGGGIDVTLAVTEFVTGLEMARFDVHVDANPSPSDPAADRGWPVGFSLAVPSSWPSGLYAADFEPGVPGQNRALFAVRPAAPGTAARILVSIPFPTFHAYVLGGKSGASPYWNEQPDRGRRVSLHRPCPEGPRWEAPILEWLAGSGYAVDYCSGFDLHDGLDLLGAYQLLVCIGHDEYWTAQMRDTAEQFLAAGGNIAFLTGNTCWWQFRLEDDGRTFVCYRDAAEDPLAGSDNAHVTVEWTSAPVNRPENSLTGTSFRRGAGCWANTAVMASAAWTATFTDHWAFEGTGLADGDTFGMGTVGYETDAVEVAEDNGVPRITGRDGAPSSFVVLARADLSDWRRWGQGGAATMGVFRAASGGTVFNAATTGWGNGLGTAPDPTVDRITRNVLTKLGNPWPADNWERIGRANAVTALAACENVLFAADMNNGLWVRDPVGQNVNWISVGHANFVRAMASPREAIGGRPIGLYAVTNDHRLGQREPVLQDVNWIEVGIAPAVVALAASYEGLFGATSTNGLVYLRFDQLGSGVGWTRVGHANNVVAMTNLNGRLFCVTSDRMLWMRLPLLHDVDWTAISAIPDDATGLAGHAGKLIISTATNQLWWRDAVR